MKGYSYGLCSSGELINNLLEKGPSSEEIMVVFDFKSLFPLIRPEPAAIELYHLLLEHTHGEASFPSCLREICVLIVHESFFKFNGKFHTDDWCSDWEPYGRSSRETCGSEERRGGPSAFWVSPEIVSEVC